MSAQIVARLADLGQTVACAESLTAGLVTARFADTPGASAVLRGGVVAYATDLKASILGIDAALLARRGPVDEEVARQMATGVCRVLASDWGLATTGVAGPDPAGGMPVGTVIVAVAGPRRVKVRRLRLEGDRASVRRGATEAVITLLTELLAQVVQE